MATSKYKRLPTDQSPFISDSAQNDCSIDMENYDQVLTCTGKITAIRWREYVVDNWKKLREKHPTDSKVKLLIICGVHGKEDGSIGDDANNYEDCEGQGVCHFEFHLPGTPLHLFHNNLILNRS